MSFKFEGLNDFAIVHFRARMKTVVRELKTIFFDIFLPIFDFLGDIYIIFKMYSTGSEYLPYAGNQ